MAQELQIRGQTEQALELLSDGKNTYPASRMVVRSLALLQAQRGDEQAALRTAEEMSSSGSDVTDSLLLQAQVRCRLGKHEQAAEILRQALDDRRPRVICPHCSWSWRELKCNWGIGMRPRS